MTVRVCIAGAGANTGNCENARVRILSSNAGGCRCGGAVGEHLAYSQLGAADALPSTSGRQGSEHDPAQQPGSLCLAEVEGHHGKRANCRGAAASSAARSSRARLRRTSTAVCLAVMHVVSALSSSSGRSLSGSAKQSSSFRRLFSRRRRLSSPRSSLVKPTGYHPPGQLASPSCELSDLMAQNLVRAPRASGPLGPARPSAGETPVEIRRPARFLGIGIPPPPTVKYPRNRVNSSRGRARSRPLL